MLRQVKRYTPSNSFGSAADDWQTAFDATDDDSNDEDDTDEDADVDGIPVMGPDSEQDEDSVAPRKPRKIVSFAEFAELRLFKY